jgi:hypothetical protein
VDRGSTGGAGAWNIAYVDHNTVAGGMGFSGQTAIGSVSCPSVSLCLASDENGNVLTSRNPAGGASSWKLAQAVRSSPDGYGLRLACPSDSLCAGVLTRTKLPAQLPPCGCGSVIYLTAHPLGGAKWKPIIIDRGRELTDVSCPSDRLCIAVDNRGDVVVGHDQAATRAAINWLSPRGQLGST